MAKHLCLLRVCMVILPLLATHSFADATKTAASAKATPISQSCPVGHRERGDKPPKGIEWQCLDQNGQPDGPWLTWYSSGQLMSERQMKQGKEHGRQRSWWPNGQLMMEGISYEGNRYKGFKYWSIDGKPTELNIETETVTKTMNGAPSVTPAPNSPGSSGAAQPSTQK